MIPQWENVDKQRQLDINFHANHKMVVPVVGGLRGAGA